MELHQLRYFIAVSEAGSFSRAAKRCHVSQPSLSQQIGKLERLLGQKLFDRLARGAVLTEAGKALMPRARRILAEVNEVATGLERDLDDGRLPLAIGAIPTIAPYVLPAVLHELTAEFPDCELFVQEDLTERLVEALVDLELDCAVTSTPIDHPLVETEVVASERLLLAAAEDHPLPTDGRLTLELLNEHRCIVVQNMHCLGQQIEEICATHGVLQRIVCRSTQLSTVRDLVALGLGISLVPEMAARSDQTSTLQYRPVEGVDLRREIAVVWPRSRSRSRLARRFTELLRGALA